VAAISRKAKVWIGEATQSLRSNVVLQFNRPSAGIMQAVGVGFSIRLAQDPESVEGHTDALSPLWKVATTF